MTYKVTLKMYFLRAYEIVRNMPDYKEDYFMPDNEGTSFKSPEDLLTKVLEA